MRIYNITFYNIKNKIEESEMVEAASQYEAMMKICHKSFNNVVLSVKEIEVQSDAEEGVKDSVTN